MTEAWFLAPVLAAVLGLVALAPLGEQVMARGVVFLDLAVAQAAAAASLWAGVWLHELPPALAPAAPLLGGLAGLAGALACALGIARLGSRGMAVQEATLGLLYVGGAALALLGARLDPHGRERLTQLLAADLLWAGVPELLTLAAAAAAVGVLQGRQGRRLHHDHLFYPLFAVVVSLAVPVLGLFVVFGALVAPALWRRQGRGWGWAAGGAFIAVGGALGASWALDWPSGACVALGLTAWGLASLGSRPPSPAPAAPAAPAAPPPSPTGSDKTA